MLKFKVKQLIEAHGVKHPAIWLKKACGMNRGKAYKIINNQQEMISLEDFSRLCMMLHCTPNDLMYWEETPRLGIHETHPCRTQLTPPAKLSNWNDLLKNLPHAERREFRDMIVQRIEQHEEERKKVKTEENS